MIIFRSSARRDQQFSEFERNERATLGSIQFTHGRATTTHDNEIITHCNDIPVAKPLELAENRTVTPELAMIHKLPESRFQAGKLLNET